MIHFISTLRCASCTLREPCLAPENSSPSLRSALEQLRGECRNARVAFAVFAILTVIGGLLALLLKF